MAKFPAIAAARIRQVTNEYLTLERLAQGRIAVGATVLVAPNKSLQFLGVAPTEDGGRDLAIRLYGVREIAFGAAYLTSPPWSKKWWAKVGAFVDGGDVAVGAAAAAKGSIPRVTAAAFIAVAAGACAIGVAHIVLD